MFGHSTERHIHHWKCSTKDTFISLCKDPESISLPRGLAAWAWGQLRDSAVEGGPAPAGDLEQRLQTVLGEDSSFPCKMLLSWATITWLPHNPTALPPWLCLATSPVDSCPDPDTLSSLAWALPYHYGLAWWLLVAGLCLTLGGLTRPALLSLPGHRCPACWLERHFPLLAS